MHIPPARGPRASLAIFDPFSFDDTMDLAILPPLPDTPPHESRVLATIPPSFTEFERHRHLFAQAEHREDSEPRQPRESLHPTHGKLVDIVTPIPTRTLQHRTPSLSTVYSMEGTIRSVKVKPEQPLTGESADEEMTMTPRPVPKLVEPRINPSTVNRSATIHHATAHSAQPTNVSPLPDSPGNPTSRTNANNLPENKTHYANQTTRFPALADDTCATDLMGDDRSFLDAMARSTSAELASPPPVSGPRIAERGEAGTPGKGFSVLAGMAAFEASHSQQGAMESIVRVCVSGSPDSGSCDGDVVEGGQAMRGSTRFLAADQTTGEVSSIFPSSPSIKRYLSTHQGNGIKMISTERGIVDGSRLEMGDLTDLRCTTLDGLQPNETIHRNVVGLDPPTKTNTQSSDPGNQATKTGSRAFLDPGNQTSADVSSIFPSSPSINRYLAAQQRPRMQFLSAEQGIADDESRLGSESLADLRSTTLHDIRANAADTTTALDQSTIYPSSPAVRRNMQRPMGDLMCLEMPDLDSRLDQSVLVVDKGKGRDMSLGVLPESSASRHAHLPPSPSRSPTKRSRQRNQGLDIGDQTLDIGAMIKKTSRKLTSDCADMTFLAPASRGMARGAQDMSMLMDIQSPFKPRGSGKGVDESYYDLLSGDNTFMKQVEEVTIEDDSPVKGNVLPVLPAPVQSRAPNDFVFKVPELPRFASPRKASESSTGSHLSPTRASRQLPLPPPTRHASPERSVPRSTTSTTPSASRTLFTPRNRQAEPESTPKRHASSDYRMTMLPPRTPLAERGFGPQSAKKTSTTSLSGVLAETDGRSVNARTAVGGSGIKRSATMNDFTPVKHQETVRVEKTPLAGRHMLAPSDSIVRSGSSTLLADHNRTTAPSSPTRTSKLPSAPAVGATSRIRLPGQGLRQVSGQGKVDDADARCRKQAMSPEKLMRGASTTRTTRPSLARKPKSPPRQRTGFRPVASQQSVPARIIDRSIVAAPGRQTAAGRLPTSRPGSSSSTMPSRSSTIPSRSSTATVSRPVGSTSSATSRMTAPSATLAGRASNGLPRPTSRVAPTSTTARPGSTTSVSSTSRLVAPTSMKDRHGSVPAVRTGSALPGRNALQTGKPEEAVRSRPDRFQPTRK